MSVPPHATQDIKIRNLKSKDKPFKVSDFEGLFILVKVSGAKSWRFKYRIEGKEKLLVIADYPATGLAQARKARDTAKAMLAEGVDPNDAKQEDKRLRLVANGQTFAKIGTAFLTKQRKESKSAATLAKTEYHLKMATKISAKNPLPRSQRRLSSQPCAKLRPRVITRPPIACAPASALSFATPLQVALPRLTQHMHCATH